MKVSQNIYLNLKTESPVCNIEWDFREGKEFVWHTLIRKACDSNNHSSNENFWAESAGVLSKNYKSGAEVLT